MKKIKLLEVCNIRSGYTGFKNDKRNDKGNYMILQLRSVDSQGILDINGAVRFNEENVKDIHILKKGEIIIRAKGRPSSAGYINLSFSNLVASSQFLRISLKAKCEGELDTEYLWWFLNQKPAQDYYKNNSPGSAQASINKKTLENTEILLPTLEKQRRIAELNRLRLEEKKLALELIEKREKVINRIMFNFIKQ
ncbi:MAG: restriction endonuclease subunit S [Clostridia bacterium]|nr:restriction endonuclease subunit S [Clostridia bacterium]